MYWIVAFQTEPRKGVERKNLKGCLRHLWAAFCLCVCVYVSECARSVSENNAITSSAACLICWPFILSGLLLRPFMSYCPNNGHLERCHTRCLSLSTLSI